ncbi:MAG: M20/M25/M40 family metallo-hydrolase [Clostridia bacterium]|nr:M20/M25/M40 family metallo-hydrolase [Clostridia bacterium]
MKQRNLYPLLGELCSPASISGREDGIRALLAEKILPFAHEVRFDALGNLIAKKEGAGNAPSVMLCAHMDEIGFLVTFIEENGMLRIAPVGGIHFSAVAYAEVVSESGIPGVLVPEGKTKPEEYGALKFYIDIGANDRKDAEKKVSVGDCFVQRSGVRRLMHSCVAGRPLDDRVGCAVLLSLAEELWTEQTEGDIYYVFSVQEEVGCRGAMTAAFGIAPEYGLCFDVTATGDVPGASPMACKLGEGAAVKIKDRSVICHEEVVQTLCRLAKEQRIPHQREILTAGGTDTSSMQLAGSGCRVGALSIPSRYIHSGVEMCDLKDANACADLAAAFVKQIGQ